MTRSEGQSSTSNCFIRKRGCPPFIECLFNIHLIPRCFPRIERGKKNQTGRKSSKNESCKPGDSAFARARFELIARPKASLDAAIELAKNAGYQIIALGADLEGEARRVAADHAQLALEARAAGERVAILSGGELTVTVRGHGRGGPNQEYALALAGLLQDTTGIAALAADTDGADGGAGSAADPAGAIIDFRTFAKMKSLGLDANAYLDDNDATAFFEQTGDLLITGPTLTNVNDIRVILVD